MKISTSLALAILASTAQGAVVSYSGVVNNGPNPATFPSTLSFSVPQFNPALGTLISATLTTATTAQANVEGDSENESPTSSFLVNIFGGSAGTLETLGTNAATVASYGPVSVDSDDEVGAPDFAGADYHDFGAVTASGSDSATTTIPSELAAFIGTGSLVGSVLDTQAWTVSGGGDAGTLVSQSQTETTWTVVYEYDAIPEPTSALLGSIALLGLLRRRR